MDFVKSDEGSVDGTETGEVVLKTLLDLPSPPMDWIVGHALSLKNDPLNFMQKNLAYGDLVALNLMGIKCYQLNHPELIGEMFQQIDIWQKLSPVWKVLEEYLGRGLFISDSDVWKKQRKLIQPAFHSSRINVYAETIVSDLNLLLDSWSDGEVVEISSELMSFTFSVVAKTLFGFTDDVGGISDALSEAMDFLVADVVDGANTFIHLPKWIPTPVRRKRKETIQVLDKIVFSIIGDRRKSPEDKGDLLSMLLLSVDEEGNCMTDTEVRNEALTLLLAGHETTANALMWALYLLALNPAALGKLEYEIDSVLEGRQVSFADLKALPYLEQVIKESMRLFPVNWMFSRTAACDTSLGDYQIPQGTTLLVSPWALHRNEEHYYEAELFKPERWNRVMVSSAPRYAYLPFGAGPRICIGNSFAMMEMGLVLAGMIQRFRFSLEEGHRVELALLATLRVKHGMRMRLEKR